MDFDVYICAARNDRLAASTILRALERRGIRCFFDIENLAPGVDFADAIQRAIEQSKVFVLLYSEAADTSRFVTSEVELATNRGKVIVPIRLDGAVPSRRFSYFLSTRQWLEAGDLSGRSLELIVDTVQRTLNSLAPPPAPVASLPSAAPPPARDAAQTGQKPGWFETLRRIFAPSRQGEEPGVATARAAVLAAVEQMSASRVEDIARRRPSPESRRALAGVAADLPDIFDQVALRAEQILTVQDPGRKLAAIDDALRQLSAARSQIARTPGFFADAVAGVASGWTDALTAERDAVQAAAEAAREIENPFIFGNPVYAQAGGLFTGRRDIALEIERNILRASQTPTLLLYGQRRMGKTSILNQLPSLLGPNFLPVLVDCQAPAMAEDPAALLRYLTRCLAGALNLRLRIAQDDETGKLERGALPLPLSSLRENPFSTFEEWLDGLLTRLPEGARLLLCLDEFERLQETLAAGWGERFFDALRHWLQHRPRMALMFVGSHTFEQLGPVWTDRFLSARRLKVSFLAEEDVRLLLTQPTPTFRMTYAPDALAEMVASSRGQPFLTQALASELVHHMNRVRRKRAGLADVEEAIAEMLVRSAEYFADLWGSRSAEERALLLETARDGARPLATPAARALRDYDVLDDDGDFAVPLVRRWVERNQADVVAR